MINEQAPTLTTQGVDLAAYADALLARFANRAIKHRTYQIATDGSQKLPQRFLDSLRWHLNNGTPSPLLLLGIAAWMRYVSAVDEKGDAIEIRDPLKAQLAKCVAESDEGEARVRALLSLDTVFGDDLAKNSELVRHLTACYLQLVAQGARTSVQQAIASQSQP